MTTKSKTNVSKDIANKKITVSREFNAPVDSVWSAWTESDLLDQWWAPKPWKAGTKSMDFREGGSWLYYMAGPEGEKHWSKVEYQQINPKKSFKAMDMFCDEAGNKNPDMPSMKWENTFTPVPSGTRVNVDINFTSEKDMRTILEMGFEEGFSSGLDNLDELLEK